MVSGAGQGERLSGIREENVSPLASTATDIGVQ